MNLEMEEFACGICLEVFGDGPKCPRILMCGHCYCTYCLEKLLMQSPNCPTCKNCIEYIRVDQIPVNFPLKSVVMRLKEIVITSSNKERKTELQIPPENSVSNVDNSQILPSEGFCMKHNYYKQLRCMTCCVWLCGMCVSLDHKQCHTLLVAEALESMKIKETMPVEPEIQLKEEKIRHINKIFGKIENMRSKVKAEIREIQIKLNLKVESLKDLGKELDKLNQIKQKINLTKSALLEHKDDVLRTTTSEDFLISTSKLANFLEYIKLDKPLELPKVFAPCLTYKDILYFNEEKNSIYTARQKGNDTQWGMITAKDHSIRIHSFQNIEPTAESVIINFRDFISPFKKSCEIFQKAFLEIWDGESYLGEVIIKAKQPSPRALNFFLLCLGVKEVSYKGTKLYKVVNKGLSGEDIRGGDYTSVFEKKKSSGAVVKGIKNWDIYEEPFKMGLVGGFCAKKNINRLSCFSVVLKDWEGVSLFGCFGQVEKGLDILQGVADTCSDSQGKINNVYIRDCGIVLQRIELD